MINGVINCDRDDIDPMDRRQHLLTKRSQSRKKAIFSDTSDEGSESEKVLVGRKDWEPLVP